MAHASVDKLIIEIGSNETVLGLLGDLAQDIKKYAGDPAGSNTLAEDLDRARKYPDEPAARAEEAAEAEAAEVAATEAAAEGEATEGETEEWGGTKKKAGKKK
jgi:hypothetical protein